MWGTELMAAVCDNYLKKSHYGNFNFLSIKSLLLIK